MKRIFIALLCASAVLACDAQDYTSYVTSTTNGNVNLRTSPSKNAPKAGTMAASDLLPCLEEIGDYDNGWYKVDYNGKPAYVSNTVSTTVNAVIPEEMFGKSLESTMPWDKIRHKGFIELTKIDNGHAIIGMDWMRVNLPAESIYYLATIKDGKVVATHQIEYTESSTPVSEIMKNASALDKPIPVGYDEFQNSLYFDGLEFSEFD